MHRKIGRSLSAMSSPYIRLFDAGTIIRRRSNGRQLQQSQLKN